MRRISLLICFLIIVCFSTYSSAANDNVAEGFGFVGVSGGFSNLIGASDAVDLDNNALAFGLSAKYFFDKFGLGISFTRENRKDSSGWIESDLSIRTLDIMYSDGSNTDNIFYLLFSVGNAEEELSFGGTSIASGDTSVMGIGLGYLKGQKGKFTWGSELKYLSLDSPNISGVLQISFHGGLMF